MKDAEAEERTPREAPHHADQPGKLFDLWDEHYDKLTDRHDVACRSGPFGFGTGRLILPAMELVDTLTTAKSNGYVTTICSTCLALKSNCWMRAMSLRSKVRGF